MMSTMQFNPSITQHLKQAMDMELYQAQISIHMYLDLMMMTRLMNQ